jgi:hypothetical protein
MSLCATSTKVGKAESREVGKARGRDAEKKSARPGIRPLAPRFRSIM